MRMPNMPLPTSFEVDIIEAQDQANGKIQKLVVLTIHMPNVDMVTFIEPDPALGLAVALEKFGKEAKSGIIVANGSLPKKSP